MGRPVYDLCSCLERLADKDLRWMLEVYTTPRNSNHGYQGMDGSDQGMGSSGQDSQGADGDADDHGSHGSHGSHGNCQSRRTLINTLFSFITNPDSINAILAAEELISQHKSSPFLKSTVAAMRWADDLWAEVDSSDKELGRLKKELHELEMAAHTYYPQYEGQFETEAEYEVDRERHYREIDEKIEACKTRVREHQLGGSDKGESNGTTTDEHTAAWPISLVLNSQPDKHLTFLQQAGLVFIFTDWDGKGRESGYRCALDKVVYWSDVVKRDREDLDGIVYNLGRAVMNRRFGGERIIGASPFKARQRVRNGEKVWTTEAPRGVKEPTVEDDVCLRLVVPVEVQKVVWERFMESLKG